MWAIVSLFNSLTVGTLFSILFAINKREQYMDIYGNHTSEYTKEELVSIEEFRHMTSDVLTNNYEQTDEFLIRWIRAYNSDLPLANSMLRMAQKWKDDNNWDTISEESHIVLKNKICLSDGIDREGNLILYIRITQEDMRKWVLRGLKRNFTRNMFDCLKKCIVKLNELSKETGKKDLGLFIIADMEGYNLKQHGCFGCIEIFGELAKLIQQVFPGVVKVVIGVNAPPILQPLIDLMRPLLPPPTLLKLKVFGREEKEWLSYLSNHVSMDQLSNKYGGKRNN